MFPGLPGGYVNLRNDTKDTSVLTTGVNNWAWQKTPFICAESGQKTSHRDLLY